MATPCWKLVRGLAIALSLSTVVMSCSSPNANVASPDGTTGSESSQAQQPVSQSISIDGSSTVYPLTDEAAKEYQFEREDEPQIAVAFSGTTGGFRKFCAGETDISNASRPINAEEMEACKAAGVQYIERPVAFDAWLQREKSF